MQLKPGAVATQRLFFALWPDPDLQQQLARAATALLPADLGRRVRAENLHCTLVFLGDVDADQRLCVEAAASEIRARAFALRLDRFGYFRRPQVAWLGCTATPPALTRLVADLGSGCNACGFPPENRPYEVHLTIARKVRRDPGRPPFLAIDWAVDRFALVESVNTDDGVRYQPLRSWAL
jgi:2'-5' RNA ligase